jgi:hypothetical protein
MKKIILATALSLVATSAAPALAQRGGWETIGTLRVDNRAERADIRVRGAERHRAIRMCNTNSNKTIRLIDVDLVFANGGEQDVNTQNSILPGRCTAAYDLRGRTRNIAEVKLAYAKSGVRGRDPILTVQAR